MLLALRVRAVLLENALDTFATAGVVERRRAVERRAERRAGQRRAGLLRAFVFFVLVVVIIVVIVVAVVVFPVRVCRRGGSRSRLACRILQQVGDLDVVRSIVSIICFFFVLKFC